MNIEFKELEEFKYLKISKEGVISTPDGKEICEFKDYREAKEVLEIFFDFEEIDNLMHPTKKIDNKTLEKELNDILGLFELV